MTKAVACESSPGLTLHEHVILMRPCRQSHHAVMLMAEATT